MHTVTDEISVWYYGQPHTQSDVDDDRIPSHVMVAVACICSIYECRSSKAATAFCHAMCIMDMPTHNKPWPQALAETKELRAALPSVSIALHWPMSNDQIRIFGQIVAWVW